MACYYYIKLPGGGEVRIPANLVPISDKNKELYDSLITEIEQYYGNEEELNDDSSLIQVLKNFDTGLHTNTLKALIKQSGKDNLINNINNRLKELPEFVDLTTALRKNILFKENKIDYKGPQSSKYSRLPINEFLEKLNEPIHKDYLSGVKTEGLLTIYSPSEIMTSLDAKMEEMDDLQINHEALSVLKRLMNSYYREEDRKKKTIYNIKFGNDISDAMVVKDSSLEDNILFYNEDNDLSLFMGLLKSIGLKIDEDKLLEVLTTHNNSVSDKSATKIDLKDFNKEKFFIGEFVKEKDKLVFVEPAFNKLFSYKKLGIKTVEEIVNLMVPFIKREKESSSAIKKRLMSLLSFLKPERYADGFTLEQIRQTQETANSVKKDKDKTIQERADRFLSMIDSSNRDFHYTKRISKNLSKPEDIYFYINSNVKLNEDLLLVTSKNSKGELFTEYIIPTKIKMNDSGVVVSGFTSRDGKYTSVYNGTIYIKNGSGEVVFKKLIDINPEIIDSNAEPLTNEEAITIIAEDNKYIPEDLVREASVRGATLTVQDSKTKRTGKVDNYSYSAIVKQVYPGKILVNKSTSGFKDSGINESKVTKIKTHKDLFFDEFTESDVTTKSEILKEHKLVYTKGNFFPIEKGDIIRYTDPKGINRYNKVLSVTDNEIFILIKRADNHYITSIPKSSIDRIYKPERSIRKSEIIDIINAASSVKNDYSIKEYEYSSFTNYEMSANGDFIMIPTGINSFETIKITNKQKKEGISFVLNPKTKQLSYEYTRIPEDISGATFFTTRLIFSNNAVNTAEYNNIYISSERGKISPNEEWQEVIYVIPDKFSLNELDRLDSGNIVRGKSILISDLKKDFAKDPNYTDDLFQIKLEEKLKAEKFKDVTKELSKAISETRNKKDEGLFIKTKGNYRVRYNANLYQTDYEDNKEFKKDFLKEGSFIVLKAEEQDGKGGTIYSNKSGRRIYRIVGLNNDILTLEYNTYNNEGKLLTIYKTLDLTKDEDSIKWLYVYSGSDNHSKLETERLKQEHKLKKKNESELKKERKDVLHSVKNKFQTIFEIKVELEHHDSGQFKKKKAWVNVDPLKKPTIVLNLYNDNTSEEDLIHEYLHLFLIALKYSPQKQQQYEQLLLNYKNSFANKTSKDSKIQSRIDTINTTNNITLLEEFFVEDISKLIAEQKYHELDDLNYINFLEAINSSLEALDLDPLVLDNSSILAALTTKMSEVFPKVKSALKTKNLILFEANFRDWLNDQIDKNKIKIECL